MTLTAYLLLAAFAASIAGLIGVYAVLINDMAKGIERQRQDNEAMRQRQARRLHARYNHNPEGE